MEFYAKEFVFKCGVPGYPNYEISTEGVVKNKNSGRILKTYIDNQGYENVELSCEGKGKIFGVHRLVAMTHIRNTDPANKTVVNHIDGNRRNNNVHNLEWLTVKENNSHSRERRDGEKISKKKIMKLYKRKRWGSLDEFITELMSL